MTPTLTTTLDIATIGENIPVEVDYTYSRRTQELVISAVVANIEDREMPVWHLLTQTQRGRLEDACIDHWNDTQQAAVEQAWEEKSGR